MGHPTAIFLSEPDPNYKCPICLDVLDDPVSLLKCGHSFCRSCLETSLRQSGRRCPECRAAVDVGDDDDDFFGSEGNGNVVHPVRAIRSAIGNLTVRCMNCLDEDGELPPSSGSGADDSGNDGDEGIGNGAGTSSSSSSQQCRLACSWTGPLSRWPLHASTCCPVALVTCPVPGCDHRCPRSQLMSHVGSPSCVKAAVATKVEEQVNGCLGELRRQMKREVERKTRDLEEKVQEEMEGRLVAEEVNDVLKKEVKGLRKLVRRLHRRLSEDGQEEQTAQNGPPIEASSASSALQPQEDVGSKRRKKKKRGRRAPDAVAAAGGALVSPASSSLDETEDSTNDEGGSSGRKRRKKSKKRRHPAEELRRLVNRSRSRAVSADSTIEI